MNAQNIIVIPSMLSYNMIAVRFRVALQPMVYFFTDTKHHLLSAHTFQNIKGWQPKTRHSRKRKETKSDRHATEEVTRGVFLPLSAQSC